MTDGSNQTLKIVCPVIKQYSPSQQAAALKEFDQVKKTYPEITRYVLDYADLRRKIRVCEADQ